MKNTIEETEGVKLIKGDPRKAVRKLAIPLILSMVIISLYNIVDSFWVAGLGADQLAGIGFAIPLEFFIITIGTSLGAGINSVVSRYIGQEDKQLADNASVHGIIFSLLVSLIITLIFTIFAKELLMAMGASGITLTYAINYAQIYFILSTVVIMPNALYGIFRAEGDTKRPMYVMVFCAILNMVLDPIFIYTFNMGIFGAAFSTILSLIIVFLIILYWLYIKKDTYLDPIWSNFNYDLNIIKDISEVAIPLIVDVLFLTCITAVMHFIILAVSTTDSVAIFENGWRLITLATEPILAISIALLSVVATNWGAKNLINIRVAYNYAVRLSTIIGIVAFLIFFFFAPQLAYLFSYSPESARLLEPTITFFRIYSWCFLLFPVGIISTYLFQGFGKGVYCLVFSIIRDGLFGCIIAVLIGIVFNFGINGVWFGLMLGCILGCLVATLFANYYINKFLKLYPA